MCVLKKWEWHHLSRRMLWREIRSSRDGSFVSWIQSSTACDYRGFGSFDGNEEVSSKDQTWTALLRDDGEYQVTLQSLEKSYRPNITVDGGNPVRNQRGSRRMVLDLEHGHDQSERFDCICRGKFR